MCQVEVQVDPVRIGIIGVGNMGRVHARDCAASDELDLVALCDRMSRF